jgi:hypothetical protein
VAILNELRTTPGRLLSASSSFRQIRQSVLSIKDLRGTSTPPRCCRYMSANLILKIAVILLFLGIFVYSFAINWR